MTKRMPSKRIDVKRALELRLTKSMSYPQIAAVLGCSHQGVRQALKPLLAVLQTPQSLQAYQANKASLFDAAQQELLGDLVDPKKRAKATLGNVAYALDKLNTMSRLERDQSTANIAVAHTDALESLEQVRDEIARITENVSRETIMSQDNLRQYDTVETCCPDQPDSEPVTPQASSAFVTPQESTSPTQAEQATNKKVKPAYARMADIERLQAEIDRIKSQTVDNTGDTGDEDG